MISGRSPAQRSPALAEGLGLESRVVEHRNEQIAQRSVFLAVVGDVLAVFESAAGQEDRQVAGVVGVGVAFGLSVVGLGVALVGFGVGVQCVFSPQQSST